MDETVSLQDKNMQYNVLSQMTETGHGIVLSNPISEETLNKNKPWRQIIRRIIADGGSNNKDILQ